MRIDDTGDRREALLQLLGHGQIVGAVANRADIDLRRKTEVQDLRHDVGRLEIERVLRECRRQHLAQFPDVVRGRLVPVLERHENGAVVHTDRRAVGECEIVGTRRKPDIVDDQRPVPLRNHLADLVFDRLEDRFRPSRCGCPRARERGAGSGRRRSGDRSPCRHRRTWWPQEPAPAPRRPARQPTPKQRQQQSRNSRCAGVRIRGRTRRGAAEDARTGFRPRHGAVRPSAAGRW